MKEIKEIDKINLFIQFLIKTGRYTNQEEVGRELGYDNKSSFSQLLKREVTSIFKNKFLSIFPEYEKFNIGIDNALDKSSDNDLLRQGLTAKDINKPLDSVTPVPNENYMWVEYADLSAAAGSLGGNNVDELPETKKRLVPREYDNGEYLVIRVDGNSMDNGLNYSIPDGSEILIKKYYLNPGEKLPIRNNLFVINARDGKALKQIIEHNTDEGYLLCHSYNAEFKDYKVYHEDILEIFIYRKIVSMRPHIPDIN